MVYKYKGCRGPFDTLVGCGDPAFCISESWEWIAIELLSAAEPETVSLSSLGEGSPKCHIGAAERVGNDFGTMGWMIYCWVYAHRKWLMVRWVFRVNRWQLLAIILNTSFSWWRRSDWRLRAWFRWDIIWIESGLRMSPHRTHYNLQGLDIPASRLSLFKYWYAFRHLYSTLPRDFIPDVRSFIAFAAERPLRNCSHASDTF